MFQGLMAPVGFVLAIAAILAGIVILALAAFDFYHFLERVCA